MTQDIIETNENGNGIRQHALVFIIYAALIALFYSPVLFGQKSLNPTLYQPHGITARGVYGEKGRTPVNTFNVDLATPAFFEFPANKLIGDIYRSGHAPLWNPYQAGGAPLAAQYSSRAFFPYQIAEDLSPVRYWDYFMLGRLFIAGFITYLFILSATGAGGAWCAFAGGLFYMFSGVFTWFINLEQLANTAMMLPVLMLAMEALARPAPRARWVKSKIVLAAIAFALTLAAGQFESALYVLALAFVYFIFRALTSNGFGRGITTLPRLGISFVTGLLMSAPLVLPFVELLERGARIHPEAVKMGMERLVSWKGLFNVITPALSYLPAGPGTIKGAGLMTNIGGEFFRFLPINGVWDTLGGYTGILPLFLILSGVLISPLRKKMPLRKELFFFLFIAAVIVLKNAGVTPFILIGKIPMFDMVWSLRWAGPVWVFSVAVGAAMGLGLVKAHLSRAGEAVPGEGKSSPILVGALFIVSAGILLGLYIAYSFIPSLGLFLRSGKVFSDAMRPYVFPSIVSGSLVTLFVIGLAFYITFFRKAERNIHALLILALVELWWCVPRGYAPHTLLMKWGPLAVGFAGAVFFFRRKMTYAFLCLAVFFGSAFLIDSLAPRGLPPYDNAFRPAPYVSAILKDSAGRRPRVAGAYGALIPNYASVLRLDDVRYANSVTPREFQSFQEKYLHGGPSGESGKMPPWFTGRPEAGPPENDFLERERGYSFLGVRYFIFPGKAGDGGVDVEIRRDFEEKFPLVYDKRDARVYRNPGALPRVYLAAKSLKAPDWERAQKVFMEGDFDPSSTVVVEDDTALSAPEEKSLGTMDEKKDDKKDGLKDKKTDDIEALISPRDDGTSGLLRPAVFYSQWTSLRLVGSEAGGKAIIALEGVPLSLPAVMDESNKKATGEAAGSGDKAANGEETKAPLSGVKDAAGPTKDSPTPPALSSPLKSGQEKAPAVPATPAPAPEEKAATGAEPAEKTPGETPPVATIPEAGVNVPSDEAPKVSPEEAPVTGREEGTAASGEEATPLAETLSPPSVTETAPAPSPGLAPGEIGAVITSYSEGEVTVDVNAREDSILVLTDLYYPGWRVKVNDEKAGLLRVNGLVRGVPVKEGRSRVVFYYMPFNFFAGLGLLAISGIFSIVLIFKDIKGD